MSQRRVLLLTAQRLTAYHWSGGRLGDTIVFNADEAGLYQFAEYLDSWPASPIYFLVDMVEEEFREDTIPHVSGGDRRSVIETRVARMFQDASYVRTHKLGRESGGRRDDRMLFSALLRPDLLSPWISNIERRELPIAGVFTVASISRFLLKAIPVSASHALIVTQQSGGLRQSLFIDGQLRLSRLAVVPRLQRRVQSSYILGEIEKFRRYLNALRLLPEGAQLEAYVVTDEATLEALRRQMPSDVNARLNRVPIGQVARRLRCAEHGQGPNADALFAHLLAKHQPSNEYGPARLTRSNTMLRAGRWLKVASLLLVLGGFGWSGFTALRAIDRAQDTRDLEERTAFYQQRYDVARGRLPPAPATAVDLEGVVDVAAHLGDYSARPGGMLAAVGGAVAANAGIELETLRWSTGVGELPPAESDFAARLGATVRSAVGGRRGTLEREPAAWYDVQLRGEVSPFDGDFRAALARVRRFAETLRSLPGSLRVDLLVLPLEVESSGRLSGDASADESAQRAPFEVRVLLSRPGPRTVTAASGDTRG